MAASYHVRSNSLPSGPHPLASHIDEQLCRLRSSETTSTSLSSISQNLDGLQDLNDCIEKILHLRFAQDSLSQEQNKKAVDELLDESLRLLDICSMTKDVLLQTKESLNEIQSILRRKRGDVSVEVKKFLASRKTLKKTFQKLLKTLKTSENKSNNDETLTMLREAQEITATVFGSLLCFISNIQSKKCNKWSIVSKLVNQKRVNSKAQSDASEFAKVDLVLQSLVDNKIEKTIKMEDVHNLEMCIQDLEEGLESLFKSLIKIRVSILNILGN